MSIVDKLAAVPTTLQYQAETLHLVPEHKLISGLYRVMYVNKAGQAKFMTFIGENTKPVDWQRIEAENTAPAYTPVIKVKSIKQRNRRKDKLVLKLEKRLYSYDEFIAMMKEFGE